MVLDYFPLDYKKFNKFLYEIGYFEKKGKETEKDSIIFDLLDIRFCKYIDKNGKLCGRKSRKVIENNLCMQHIKKENYININNKRIRRKDIIYKCISNKKNGKKCNRNVKNPGDLCNYHKNSKMPKNKFDISLTHNVNNTRRKEEIKNCNNILIEKYRNMEMLEYLVYNNFEIINNGIRKKIKKEKWYFTINMKNNLFVDNFDKKKYGRGLLNLIIYLYNYNIKDSILHIEEYINNKNKNQNSFSSFPSGLDNLNCYSKMPNNKFEKNVILPPRNDKNINNIKKYLNIKRCISKNIINDLIMTKLIYSDDKNNCVFINKDKTFSLSKGIGKKKFFRCSGNPDFIEYGSNSDTVYLFESPIDAISYMDLNNNNYDIFLSTNGDMMINKIKTFVKKNNIKKIYTCFDNDEKGEIFHNIIVKDLYNFKKIKIFRRKSLYKDWNEDLQNSRLTK